MKHKVGTRGRHVEIPEGCMVVSTGAVQKGDKFLLCPNYKEWVPVEDENIGEDAELFDCLIRLTRGETR